MERAGLPVFPGSTEPVTDLATAVTETAVRIASRTSRRPCGSWRNAAAWLIARSSYSAREEHRNE